MLSDAELVNGCLVRDERAWKNVSDKYGRLLLSIAHGILGDLQRAEDAVQDTYIRLVRALPRIAEQAKQNLRQILARLCRWCAKSIRRKEFKRRETELPQEPPDNTRATPLFRKAVCQCVLALPRDLRGAVWLHYVHGVPYEHLTANFGVTSKGSVSKQMKTIMEQLRQCASSKGWDHIPA